MHTHLKEIENSCITEFLRKVISWLNVCVTSESYCLVSVSHEFPEDECIHTYVCICVYWLIMHFCMSLDVIT